MPKFREGAGEWESYEQINCPQLREGDEIIYQRKYFDYKTGRPAGYDLYRTIAKKAPTVSGLHFKLFSEPNVFFPKIPTWQLPWIWAGNNEIWQMWRKKENAEN